MRNAVQFFYFFFFWGLLIVETNFQEAKKEFLLFLLAPAIVWLEGRRRRDVSQVSERPLQRDSQLPLLGRNSHFMALSGGTPEPFPLARHPLLSGRLTA